MYLCPNNANVSQTVDVWGDMKQDEGELGIASQTRLKLKNIDKSTLYILKERSSIATISSLKQCGERCEYVCVGM